MAKDDDSLLEQAKKRFKQAQEAEQKQRIREKDDLRFQVPEEQWDAGPRAQREGKDGTPARPILSVDKLSQPVQLVLNQERQAHLGVQIQPLSPDAGVETATILEGIYRGIERDSQAHQARSWGFDRASKCGRGAYRIITKYDDYGGDPLDQVICIERILHQENVYFDPAAEKPDFSDGEFAFEVGWMALDTFKRQFPDATRVPSDGLEFESLVTEAPEWVREDAMLVARYWHKEHTTEEIKRGGRTRKKDVVTIEWADLSGFEVLEKGEWDGHHIPLVRVIGRELQPYDGERRWFGVITPAKDAQRGFNYAISNTVESHALEPKAPFVADPRQIEGYEDMWTQSNTRNFPVLFYNATIDPTSQQLIPPPQRVQVDASKMQLGLQLMTMCDNAIQGATATYDPSLGRLAPQKESGKAIMAQQQQTDASQSHYLQNLAEISMAYEAKVILDLIPAIYDRPGRIARTLDEEGEGKTIMLNRRFYTDPKSKMPVPLEPGQNPPMPPGMGAPGPGMPPHGPMAGQSGMLPGPPEVKEYDLRKGAYSVAVNIGKEKQTAMAEGSEAIGQIIQSQPDLMPVLGPTWMKYQSWPGARELAKILAKMRDKQFPGLVEKEGEQPDPQQMAEQMQQMQQALEAMQGQLQEAAKALKTEQAKQQAMVAKAQLDAQTRIGEAQLEAETKRAIAAADNATKLEIAQLTGRIDEMLTLLKVQGEAYKIERQAERDNEQAAASRTHEVVMGELGRPAPERPEETLPEAE